MDERSLILLGDDVVELIEGEAVVALGAVDDVGVVHHLGDLVVVHGLAQFPGDPLEGVEVDHAGALLVPELEHLAQSLATLAVAGLRSHDLEELVELDGAVEGSESLDHLEHDGAAALETELLEHLLDFFGVDGSSSVGVEQLEGLLEGVIVVLADAVSPGGLDLGGRSPLAVRHLAAFHIGYSNYLCPIKNKMELMINANLFSRIDIVFKDKSITIC